MKYGPLLARWLLPASMLAVATVIFIALVNSKPPAELRTGEINNNPDKFHLCISNFTCECEFTYDPRAADEWLFHTGGPAAPATPDTFRPLQ